MRAAMELHRNSAGRVVFLDFEGDPFVGANGLEYLTGFGHVDDNGHFAFGRGAHRDRIHSTPDAGSGRGARRGGMAGDEFRARAKQITRKHFDRIAIIYGDRRAHQIEY